MTLERVDASLQQRQQCYHSVPAVCTTSHGRAHLIASESRHVIWMFAVYLLEEAVHEWRAKSGSLVHRNRATDMKTPSCGRHQDPTIHYESKHHKNIGVLLPRP